MNILYLYNATQTYTNTVFEHIAALGAFSQNRAFFMHTDSQCADTIDMARFDAICVHYSVRLPYDELSPVVSRVLRDFRGLKFLFIQDEYNNTHRAWHWIKYIGFQLVFTVVPEANISQIYPPSEFPNTRFVSNLTGYVPSFLPPDAAVVPPSQRPLVVGYRGRPLPAIYGMLGFEKVGIGKMVREYCNQRDIRNDIAWAEESRIYGPAWTEFVQSCRAMLGSESGSNVFDWDGCLQSKLDAFTLEHPNASDVEVYEHVVKPIELNGVMNQVSPKVFEAIAARTVLVLFEGEYSGVVQAEEHFIALKKDGSNLDEVFERLEDKEYVDNMAERAYQDVIGSGKFSYPTFVAMVDRELAQSYQELAANEGEPCVRTLHPLANVASPLPITVSPIRASVNAPQFSRLRAFEWNAGVLKLCVPLGLMWSRIPEPVRAPIRPVVRHVKRAITSRGQ